jgi:hypothetical protein
VHDISMTSPAPLRIRSGVLIVRPRMTATAMAATWAAYLTINEGLRLHAGVLALANVMGTGDSFADKLLLGEGAFRSRGVVATGTGSSAVLRPLAERPFQPGSLGGSSTRTRSFLASIVLSYAGPGATPTVGASAMSFG